MNQVVCFVVVMHSVLFLKCQQSRMYVLGTFIWGVLLPSPLPHSISVGRHTLVLGFTLVNLDGPRGSFHWIVPHTAPFPLPGRH